MPDEEDEKSSDPLKRAIASSYGLLTQGQVPNIIQSLRVLQMELTAQVKRGWRTSPLRVIKLLYSSLLVTVCAVVAQFPGFATLRRVVSRRWPKLVDHLAATLEKNLAEDDKSSNRQQLDAPAEKPGVLEDFKNFFEDVTGIDIDGDGWVGAPPPVKPSSRLPVFLVQALARGSVLSSQAATAVKSAIDPDSLRFTR